MRISASVEGHVAMIIFFLLFLLSPFPFVFLLLSYQSSARLIMSMKWVVEKPKKKKVTRRDPVMKKYEA